MKPTILHWNPILVGVDGSPESAGAAVAGCRLAHATGTACHLVHAVEDPGTAFAAMVLHEGVETIERAVARLARPGLRSALEPHLPPHLLDAIHIRIGRPVTALQREAGRLGSDLVILGGKRHSAAGRWLAGSTAREAVRALPVPVLVTRGTPGSFRRVLVGLDLTYAAEPAIHHAERFARLAGAQLRAVHVLEPTTILPTPKARASAHAPDVSPIELLESDLWPLVRVPDAQRTVRTGDPATVLASEAADWDADLLVVGSHRKRWLDRLLLGTVTERLLDNLPVSLLVVPAGGPPVGDQGDRPPARAEARPTT